MVLNMTFGVELEFVAVFKKGTFNNKISSLVPLEGATEIYPGHAIYHCLNMAGVPATGYETDLFQTREPAPYSRWTVKEDVLDLTDAEGRQLPNGWITKPVEITSRILSMHSGDWHAEIRHVLSVLDNMKRIFECDFIVNEMTGMHVHIGNNAGKLIPFATGKRVAQLYTAFESRIDGLHRANRITALNIPVKGFREEDCAWCWPLYAPLSFFHSTWSNEVNVGSGNMFSWLADLEQREDYQHLSDLMRAEWDDTMLSGHNCTVNFDNSVDSFDEEIGLGVPGTHTIEFRQHCGSLDQQEILSYIAFLGTLVNFCHTANDVEFFYLLTQCTDTTFGLDDFLIAIGCSEDLLSHFVAGGIPDLGRLPDTCFPLSGTNRLQGLAEINDLEQMDLSDADAVQRRIDIKYTSGYYGLDPTAGKLPLTQEEIRWMLACAYQKAEGTPELDRLSCARAGLFTKLSKLYEELDCGLDDQTDKVLRIFADWMGGSPQL